MGDVDIEKVLVSNKISFGVENYKYFIDYFYNGNKLKPLNIMLPKASAYLQDFDGQSKWIYVLIEDYYLESIILFGIKSALI